jgi:CBS domain-containing protein
MPDVGTFDRSATARAHPRASAACRAVGSGAYFGVMSSKHPSLAAAMTPFPFSIGTSATLREARAMMVEHDIHHLPVTDAESIVGVISDGDLFLAGALGQGRSDDLRVDVVYSRAPYVVDIHASLAEVARTMADRRIGSALVTRHGKLAGILTHTDVARTLADLLDALHPPPTTDQAA